jgi:signal transduction histidine kinase
MKKRIVIFLGFSFFLLHLSAQPFNVDSLKRKIESSPADTNYVLMLAKLSTYYNHNHLDSGFYFAQKVITLSQQLKYAYGEALGLSILATSVDRTGDMTKSFEIALSCLHLAEKLKYGSDEMMMRAYTQMGTVNFLAGHSNEAISYLHNALVFAHRWKPNEESYYQIYAHLSNAFRRQGLIDTGIIHRHSSLDSSLYYGDKAYALSQHSTEVFFFPYARNCEGDIYDALGKEIIAKQFYRDAVSEGIRVNHLFQLSYSYSQLASIFNNSGILDSCIYFAKKSLGLSQEFYYGAFIPQAANQLSMAFEKLHQNDSALKYLKLTMTIKDKVMNQTKQQQFQLLNFEEQQRNEKAELASQQYIVKVRTAILAAGLIVLVILMSLLYRNNRIEQKSNLLLQQQKEKVEHTLSELRLTQAQLIQSEKMASLGELTAGIAHEIQNPLNFVNNFSEVNKELAEELTSELAVGNSQSATEIANNIKENSKKINHHGKRADAIVKGMLQHSRSSTSVKEPTNINALTDEYLRLSYHGLRAKDNSFNAIMKTDFDESIGKINIAPQDIGRVLLNLYTNAFYAVGEKLKAEGSKLNAEYIPTITVATKKSGNQVFISVSDNGNGIARKIVDKIFQPFFTTKPTGEGTGLGLSLSYDIVKAHGGEIKVETKEDEGTTFIIKLPIV